MKDALLGALIGLARALCENEHMATGETGERARLMK